jgi:hypothetical protein
VYPIGGRAGNVSAIEPAFVDAVTEAGTAVNAAVIEPAVEVRVAAGEASPVAVITPAMVFACTGP